MGCNLSGQTVEAFYVSIQHANPFCVGLNCSWGAEEMRPYLGIVFVFIFLNLSFALSFCLSQEGFNKSNSNVHFSSSERLHRIAECYVHCYPNAGIPDALGNYTHTPEVMAPLIKVNTILFQSPLSINHTHTKRTKHTALSFTEYKTIILIAYCLIL
jgi:5-methyltetrahydrofolate--homocysteine methyltransferase